MIFGVSWFFWTIKGRTLFFQQKSAVRVVFMGKLCFKDFNIDIVLLNDIHESKIKEINFS